MFGIELEPAKLEDVLEQPLSRADHLMALYTTVRRELAKKGIALDGILTQLREDFYSHSDEVQVDTEPLIEGARAAFESIDVEAYMLERAKEYLNTGRLKKPFSRKADPVEETLRDYYSMLNKFLAPEFRAVRRISGMSFTTSLWGDVSTGVRNIKSTFAPRIAESVIGKLQYHAKQRAKEKGMRDVDDFIDKYFSEVNLPAVVDSVIPYSNDGKTETSRDGIFFATYWKRCTIDGYAQRQQRDFGAKYRALLGKGIARNKSFITLPDEETKAPSLIINYDGKKLDSGKFKYEGEHIKYMGDVNLGETATREDLRTLVGYFLAYQDFLKAFDKQANSKMVPIVADRPNTFIDRFLEGIGLRSRIVGYERVYQ